VRLICDRRSSIPFASRIVGLTYPGSATPEYQSPTLTAPLICFRRTVLPVILRSVEESLVQRRCQQNRGFQLELGDTTRVNTGINGNRRSGFSGALSLVTSMPPSVSTQSTRQLDQGLKKLSSRRQTSVREQWNTKSSL